MAGNCFYQVSADWDDQTHSGDDYDGTSEDASEPEDNLETQNPPRSSQNSELSLPPVYTEHHSDTNDADVSDSSTNSIREVTSKYFAGATIKRKKRHQAKGEQSRSDEYDSSELSEMEQTLEEWVQRMIPGMRKDYSRYLPENLKV